MFEIQDILIHSILLYLLACNYLEIVFGEKCEDKKTIIDILLFRLFYYHFMYLGRRNDLYLLIIVIVHVYVNAIYTNVILFFYIYYYF